MKGFLQVFDLIIALTGGGPGTETESVSVVIYRGGFEGAYQSANAVVFLIVLVVVAIIQLRYLQRREVSL